MRLNFPIRICVAALAVVGAFAAPARAATFTVNSAVDSVDSIPGDGSCQDNLGRCTLRAAIMEANHTLPGASTILIPAGTYTLALTGRSENAGETGDLDIRGQLTITGAGATATIIDGGAIDRVFEVHPGATVLVQGVTVRNGNTSPAGESGGGIYSEGILTVTNSIVTGNSAYSGGGIVSVNGRLAINSSTISSNQSLYYAGGIWNDGGTAFLTLIDSTVSGNSTAAYRGGGIVNMTGQATMTNSTISGNSTGLGGPGGIWNWLAGSKLVLINSTVSGNTGKDHSGGILNDNGTTTLVNSTVSGNTDPTGPAGGIYNRSGSTTIKNTIVAGNTIGSVTKSTADCGGNFISLGHNLASDNSCNLNGTGDLNNTNPMLGPLASNGGPTMTHTLLTGSPAINAVPVLDCTNGGVPLATDQRGVARPQGAACDSGSVEVIPSAGTRELFLGAARAYPPPGTGSPVFFFDGVSLTQSASVLTSTGSANSYGYPDSIPRTMAAFVINGETYLFNVIGLGGNYFKVFKWSGADLLEIASLSLANRPVSMAVSHDAKKAYVGIATAAGPAFGQVHVIDLTNPAAPTLTGQVFPYGGLIMDIRPQGDVLLIRGFSSVYAVTITGQLVWTLPAPAVQSTMLRIEPTQGGIAFIADNLGNVIKLSGIGTPSPTSLTIAGPGLPFFPYDAVFHPSGKWLYVSSWPAGANASGFVLKVDTAAGTASTTGSAPLLAHYAIALSAAANRVYLTGASNTNLLHTYNIDNLTGDLAFTSSIGFPVTSVVSPFALAVPLPPIDPGTIDAISLVSIAPNRASAGSPGQLVRAVGKGFVPGSIVRWTSPTGTVTSLATAPAPVYKNPPFLMATVPANLLTTAGTAQVSVMNPGGMISNSLPFLVDAIGPPGTTGVARMRRVRPGDPRGEALTGALRASETSDSSRRLSTGCTYRNISCDKMDQGEVIYTGYSPHAEHSRHSSGWRRRRTPVSSD